MFCLFHTICENAFSAKVWFVKASTRVVKYELRAILSDHVHILALSLLSTWRGRLFAMIVRPLSCYINVLASQWE